MLTKESIRLDVNFWLGVYRAVRRRGNGRLTSFYWVAALWYLNL